MGQVTPITILTGYLGSGKTTLLNRILNTDHGMRVAVLVNDFGAINIDAQTSVNIEGEMISLANGCICCTIRDDLVTAVDGLLKRPELPDYIVIEASGVSDPAQVVITFNRSSIRARVQIDSIITVIDSEQFSEIEGKPQKLIRDQLRVADIVILNKIDLVTGATLADIRNLVTDVVPKARILEATYCNVPLELIVGVNAYNPQWAFQKDEHGVHVHAIGEDVDHEHSDHSLVFSSWTWTCDEALSLSTLRRALDDLPTSVFRMKGIINVAEIPDKKIQLQLVGKRVSLTEGGTWGDETPSTQITLIGAYNALDAQLLKAAFEDCRASNEPPSEFTQFVDGVLRWMRVKQ